MNKEQAIVENRFLVAHLQDCNYFRKAIKNFIKNLELEEHHLDEIGFCDCQGSAEWKEQELRQEYAIEMLKDATVCQFKYFDFFCESLNDWADNYDYCLAEINDIAIKIIEEL